MKNILTRNLQPLGLKLRQPFFYVAPNMRTNKIIGTTQMICILNKLKNLTSLQSSIYRSENSSWFIYGKWGMSTASNIYLDVGCCFCCSWGKDLSRQSLFLSSNFPLMLRKRTITSLPCRKSQIGPKYQVYSPTIKNWKEEKENDLLVSLFWGAEKVSIWEIEDTSLVLPCRVVTGGWMN